MKANFAHAAMVIMHIQILPFVKSTITVLMVLLSKLDAQKNCTSMRTVETVNGQMMLNAKIANHLKVSIYRVVLFFFN